MQLDLDLQMLNVKWLRSELGLNVFIGASQLCTIKICTLYWHIILGVHFGFGGIGGNLESLCRVSFTSLFFVLQCFPNMLAKWQTHNFTLYTVITINTNRMHFDCLEQLTGAFGERMGCLPVSLLCSLSVPAWPRVGLSYTCTHTQQTGWNRM